jgi:anaerobic magnesium-protoporphyrin IX monomethyl ester cyclase
MIQNKIVFVHIQQSNQVFASSPYIQLSAFPQLGLLYLCSTLRKNNFNPLYLDNACVSVFDSELKTRLFDKDLIFVGFYSNIALRKDVCSLIQKIRAISVIPVLVGGPGFFEAEYYFQAGANAVVGGEAEEIIVEIAKRIQNKSSLAGIPGVNLPGTEQELVPAPPVMDLDQLEYPASDLAPPDRYYNHLSLYTAHPFSCMLASRGCQMNCSFCSQMYPGTKRTYRLRNPDNVIKEMRTLRQQYGIRHIKFQDDNFGGNREWLEHFCHGWIQQKMHLSWNCSMNPLFFLRDSEFLLKLMYKAGCVCIHFGLQSANPDILKKVNRNPNEPDLIMKLIPLMKRIGYYTIIDFIYGLPGET